MGKPERVPYYKTWYKENIVDNQEDIWHIGETASLRIFKDLKISMPPEMIIAFYCNSLEGMMDYLKKKQTDYTEFWINVQDTLEIGYTNNENEDDEKQGNFMIQVNYLPDAPRVNVNDFSDDAETIATSWASQNMSASIEYLLKEIMPHVKNYLKTHVDLIIERAEVVLLLFMLINEVIIGVVKTKRQESAVSDYFITVGGLVSIHCQETDDGDRIFFKAEPSAKIMMKSDGDATAVHES